MFWQFWVGSVPSRAFQPVLRRQSLSAPCLSLAELSNHLGSFTPLVQILLARSRSVKNNKVPTRVIGGHKRKNLLPKGKILNSPMTCLMLEHWGSRQNLIKKLLKKNHPSLTRGNIVVLTRVKIIFWHFTCRFCNAKFGNYFCLWLLLGFSELSNCCSFQLRLQFKSLFFMTLCNKMVKCQWLDFLHNLRTYLEKTCMDLKPPISWNFPEWSLGLRISHLWPQSFLPLL